MASEWAGVVEGWKNRAEKAEAERDAMVAVNSRGCDCSTEDACRFARERNALITAVENIKMLSSDPTANHMIVIHNICSSIEVSHDTGK
jgi:hypothetical protein